MRSTVFHLRIPKCLVLWAAASQLRCIRDVLCRCSHSGKRERAYQWGPFTSSPHHQALASLAFQCHLAAHLTQESVLSSLIFLIPVPFDLVLYSCLVLLKDNVYGYFLFGTSVQTIIQMALLNSFAQHTCPVNIKFMTLYIWRQHLIPQVKASVP